MQEFVPRRSCTGQERAPGTSGDGRHGASLGRHRRAHAWVLGAAHPPAVGLALGAGGRAGRHDRATLCCRARCAGWPRAGGSRGGWPGRATGCHSRQLAGCRAPR
jgi:hypothetical protein